jgi:hypothetical protein
LNRYIGNKDNKMDFDEIKYNKIGGYLIIIIFAKDQE